MTEPATDAGRMFARLMAAPESECVILREATPLEVVRFYCARTRSLMRGRKRRRPGRARFKVKASPFNIYRPESD